MSSALPGSADTIIAQATVGARSALAVIRLSGPDALRIAGSLLAPWHPAPPRRVFLATLRDASGQHVDRGIVTVFHAPASYTGEDMVELSLHGGDVGPALALSALLAAGARHALPGEFTRRAVLNGKLDLLQAEAVGDLIDARTRAMHDVAFGQLAGHLSARLNELRDRIIDLEALIAYDVDFPEEDDGPIATNRILNTARGVLDALGGLLATASTGEMIRGGAIVVIAGAPNAGKSSLFNALIGTQRAIVTELPGTTRDALEAMIDVGRWPVRLVDTAGLRTSDDVIERLGIEVATDYLGRAATVRVCGDSLPSLVDAMARVRSLTDAHVITIATKGDAHEWTPAELQSIPGAHETIAVSARSGDGLPALLEKICAVLDAVQRPLSADTPMLTRERHRLALECARAEMSAFLEAWTSEHPIPAVVCAVHLHSARGHLEELVGVLDVEDVLDRLFSSFCVGK